MVFLSIIRSQRLYVQLQVYVVQVRWLLESRNKVELSFYMFQMVFTSIIRTPRLCIQFVVCVVQFCWLLASGHEKEREFYLVPASKQSTNLYDIHLKVYVQSWTPDDGRKDHPKHVEWYSISLKIVVHLSWFYYRNILRFTVPMNIKVVDGVTHHLDKHRHNMHFHCHGICPPAFLWGGRGVGVKFEKIRNRRKCTNSEYHYMQSNWIFCLTLKSPN